MAKQICEKKFLVEGKHLANIVGSGNVPVLSTPYLLAFIENTCNESIQHLIDENNKTSVGVKCNLTHIKPNILGQLDYP